MKFVFSLSKKRFLAIVSALLVIALLGVGLFGLKCWEIYDGNRPLADPSADENRPEYYFNGQKYTPKKDIESILFLGIDEHETSINETNVNGTQADLLMLYVLDHRAKTYVGVQINRDTMTKFDTIGLNNEVTGSMKAQIALSHAFGTGGKDSSQNTVNAASGLFFNTPISHFFTIRMDAVPVLNDTVGGITVELLDDFTSLDPSFEKGKTVTLKGDQATAYVQYRGQLEDSSNVSRMARQKQYMSAWTETFFDLMNTDENFTTTVFQEISDYMLTDMTVNHLDSLSKYFSSYTSLGVLDIAGDPPIKGDKHMEFYADDQALQQMVFDLFYKPIK